MGSRSRCIYYMTYFITGKKCTQKKLDNCLEALTEPDELPDRTDDDIRAIFNDICR